MPIVIKLMAIGTVLIDLGIIAAIVMLLRKETRATLRGWTRAYGLVAIIFLSAVASIGALCLEFFAGMPPCLFCWWQRVFMFPVAIISLIAFVKNVDVADIADYVLGLSVIGAAFAFYQHLLQMLPSGSLIPCDAANECAVRSVFEFNFVTLPWMAFSVFSALFLIALLGRNSR